MTKSASPFLLFLLVITGLLQAQPPASRYWYFGNTAGLDFGTNPIDKQLNECF
jgi:hypothetical protein